jgi:hypothetical protein
MQASLLYNVKTDYRSRLVGVNDPESGIRHSSKSASPVFSLIKEDASITFILTENHPPTGG